MDLLNSTREERTKNLEEWADHVIPDDLEDASPEVTQKILEALDGNADMDEVLRTTS